MSLPILSYGHAILQQDCTEINENYPALSLLINDMWETLYQANGCGLAAPQVGHAIRLFLVDSSLAYASMHPESRPVYFDDNNGLREIFINARITNRSERTWKQEEACLSLPGLQAEVERAWTITIEYLDKDFQPQIRTISGLTARMIQHEYDHTHGILYIDYLKPFKKKLMQGRLKKIGRGLVDAKYPMQFPA